MTKTNPARRGSVLLLHASLHLLATVVVAFLYGIAIADMHIIQTFLTVDGGQLVSANLSAIGFMNSVERTTNSCPFGRQ